VPFAALIERESGRHVVERYAISVHPTFTDAVDTSQPTGGERNMSLALIADPAFSADSFPGLERLPSAASEVESLPLLYHRAWVLAADSATPMRVLDALTRASVVHVSAHAVVDERNVERSVVVLAKSAEAVRPSSISAETIRHLRLTQLRLVVLASCRSGMSGVGSGAGMLGFAAAFREAGAQSVVGALWAIDDRVASTFAERLHREFRATGDGARALRSAQLSMMASRVEQERSVSSWAAFTITGY
jgi:CHAT domain-containing protein